MQTSISFDHAADFYDQTRALPAAVRTALAEAITVEMERVRASRLLEIGIGTGRIARPLAARGIRVCGIDIAPRMLARLRQQLRPSDVEPDLILGDATALPLADGSFAAGILVHVLHLVPAWPQAVAEAGRVLCRPGCLMQFRARYEDERGPEESALWDDLLAKHGFQRRRRPRWQEIQEALTAAGGVLRTVLVARGEETWSPARDIQVTRQRIHSWTWEIPEEIFAASLPLYEAWALERYGDPQLERVDRVSYELEAWTFEV